MADADITIHAPGGIIFTGRLKNPMPGSEQGRGDGFTFPGLNRLPVKEKFQGLAPSQVLIQSI